MINKESPVLHLLVASPSKNLNFLECFILKHFDEYRVRYQIKSMHQFFQRHYAKVLFGETVTLTVKAQACVGFLCAAIEKTQANSIVTSAGSSASELVNFPFLIAQLFAIFIVVIGGLGTVGRLGSGRDWVEGFIGMGATAIVLVFINEVVNWVAGVGGGTTAGTGIPAQ